MERRLAILALALGVAVPYCAALAGDLDKPWLVGLVSVATALNDPIYEGFRKRLRDLGYVEGRNLKIEFRSAQGQTERIPQLAEELTQLRPDVIVVGNQTTARILMGATSSIPIVLVASDPRPPA